MITYIEAPLKQTFLPRLPAALIALNVVAATAGALPVRAVHTLAADQ